MARDTSNTDCMWYRKCPDCGAKCTFKFSLPTDGGDIMHLTTCGKCKDHATIPLFSRLRIRATFVRTVSPDVVRRLRS